MMSYGNTAETSFSLVRTLVAHDPGLLDQVDAVLQARGFAKLVTGDTFASRHPRARAEAVRELKWLGEYLQNVHNRADKFAPPGKPARLAVVDDEDEEPLLNGHARTIVDVGGARAEAPQNGHFQEADGSATSRRPREYDHTSEESDETSEEPEERQPQTAQLNQRTEPHDVTAIVTEAPQGSRSPPEASVPVKRAEDSKELRKPEEAELESRVRKRQRHMIEREHARQLHEQLRAQREQQRAQEEQQRQLRNQQKQQEKRQRAAEALAESDISDGGDVEIWCLCRKPAYGFMLACVNPKCPYEWFHGDCVGLKAAPKARWFCPVCRPKYGLAAPAAVTHAADSKAVVKNERPHTLKVGTARARARARPADKPAHTRKQTLAARQPDRRSSAAAQQPLASVSNRPRRVLRSSSVAPQKVNDIVQQRERRRRA